MEIERLPTQSINALFTFLNGLENILVWVCTSDYQKQIFLSESFDNLWGRPREYLYKNIKNWSQSVLPEDLKIISDEIYNKRTLESGRCSSVKFRIIRPNSELHHFKSTSYTFYNSGGTPMAIVGIDELLSSEQWQTNKIIASSTPLLKELSDIFQKELKLSDFCPANKFAIPSHFCINNKTVNLTNRERECLSLLLQGKSAKETANLMNISFRTVETHFEHIKDKTHCRTKTVLISKLYKLL